MEKELTGRHKDDLLEVLMLAAKDKRLLDVFLKDLLTPAEYRELATRWQIVKQLEQGIGHREIARELKVGLSTVTRGSRVLESETGGANQILHKLLARK